MSSTAKQCLGTINVDMTLTLATDGATQYAWIAFGNHLQFFRHFRYPQCDLLPGRFAIIEPSIAKHDGEWL